MDWIGIGIVLTLLFTPIIVASIPVISPKRRRKKDGLACKKCGYCLKHICTGTCPECGLTVPSIEPKAVCSCPKCGYNLRRLTGNQCPECGVELRRTGVFPPGKPDREQLSWWLALWAISCPAMTFGVLLVFFEVLWEIARWRPSPGAVWTIIGIVIAVIWIFGVRRIKSYWAKTSVEPWSYYRNHEARATELEGYLLEQSRQQDASGENHDHGEEGDGVVAGVHDHGRDQ